MAKYELTPESRRFLGERVAFHMQCCNKDANMVSTALHDFYLTGVEQALLCVGIPFSYNKSDNRERYVSMTLDGETFPVPASEPVGRADEGGNSNGEV